jgi:threonine synthase
LIWYGYPDQFEADVQFGRDLDVKNNKFPGIQLFILQGKPMSAIFKCSVCGNEFPLNSPVWQCTCGGLLDITGLPAFRPEQVEPKKTGLWRYAKSIPVDYSFAVTLGEGFTPLVSLELSGRKVYIKQDQLFPTGSYKDRGASVLVSHIQALDIRHVVEDSSGNAGCAVAAYCANAGILCDIYVPADTSPGKLAQIEWYGANLIKVPGSREATALAAMEAAQKFYYASHSWNPLFFQGTKTFAYEVCEQMDWDSPDWIVLPAGNGTLLLGAYLGFVDLFDSGIISKMPKICAVQAENCSPLAEAFRKDSSDIIEKSWPHTLAEGIAIAGPIRGKQILAAVRQSAGGFTTVSEDEILNALREIGTLGYFIEPTAAATIAGVKKMLANIPEDQSIVTVFTGHGLKAAEKMLKIKHQSIESGG